MNGRTASITFFSGTGNTRHACTLLAAGLERAGWRVRLREIAPPRPEPGTIGEAGVTPTGQPADLAVLAFPVFAFGMPHLVRSFVRRLPPVDGVPAAVLAVYGDDFAGPPSARRRTSGFEGGALGEAARLLSRRGYVVRTSRGVGFPASFTQALQPPVPDEQRLIVADSDATVEGIAADLDAGRHVLMNRRPVLRAAGGIVRALFSLLGRRVLGKLYVADGRCTSCGWCERACPASAIRMRGQGRARRLPRWSWRCEACQRCINGCPEAAIQVSALRLLLLAGVALLPYGRWFAAAAPGISFPGSRFLAWFVGTLLLTVAVDLLVRLLERVPGVRRSFWISHTRNFRRYRGPSASGAGGHPGAS
ncbi:MAG: EFR1 family ferrodoxin [Spirochaetes bacterium]|nr:EFR1 family ferrodoxin [Spirochaetota bacterium]